MPPVAPVPEVTPLLVERQTPPRISPFQDDASEEVPLAHCPRRARPVKLSAPTFHPALKVTQQATPAVVEADAVAPATADIATPVVASVKAKTIAPAEVNAFAPVDARAAAPEAIPPA